tara:strand:- start:331 stop:1161 length:831 start_codon:yes stop_codon:yes gene_type:complete
MLFRDFIFNYKSCLICLIKEKNFFTFGKRILLLPYKYILSNLRDFLKNINIDKQFSLENKSLDDLFKYFDCDKSSLVHGYSKFYLQELEKFKDSKINILEFGIHFGSSQAALSKYFSKANIIGVDKNPYFKKFYSKKIRSLYCDVSDRNSLKFLRDYLNTELDVIIDDASHIPEHQLLTFIETFDLLKSKGIYVVEELDIFESFPENYNTHLKIESSELRNFLHHLNNQNIQNINKHINNHEILSKINKIEWVKIFRGNYEINGKNVSEIAFIKKI